MLITLTAAILPPQIGLITWILLMFTYIWMAGLCNKIFPQQLLHILFENKCRILILHIPGLSR